MRGLAMELMFSRDVPRTNAAMKLLRRYKSLLTAELVVKPYE